MAFFIQLCFNGIALGCIYALIALGFTIIFKASEVINFAQGEFLLLGAYFASAAYFDWNIAVFFDFLIGIAFSIGVFVLVQWAVRRNRSWNPTGRWAFLNSEALLGIVSLFGGIALGDLSNNLFKAAGLFQARMGFLLAVILGIIVTIFVGIIFERFALRRMIGRPVFSILMITIGLDIILRTGVVIQWGSTIRPPASPFQFNSGFDIGDVKASQGVHFGANQLWTIIITVVICALLFLFFRFTKYGLAMRATAIDQEAALAIGINVRTVYALAWGIAGAIATIGGVFLAIQASAFDSTLGQIALLAFPAIILGGLDSVVGAVVGGILIGLTQDLTAGYDHYFASVLGPSFQEIAPYILMIIILFIRPYGIFGTRKVERV